MRKAWSVKRAVCHPIILQVKSLFFWQENLKHYIAPLKGKNTEK